MRYCKSLYINYLIMQQNMLLKIQTLKISFSAGECTFDVKIDMLSLKIEDDELFKITQDGFCGRNAKKLKEWKGYRTVCG